MIAEMLQKSSDGAMEQSFQALSIEKACEEYNNSVKLTLEQINHQLDDMLLKNSNGLDELSVKIAARTNFLEKNPMFLSCLVYGKECVKCERLLEFDDIKITLREHCKRIHEKLDEIEGYHQRLLELVVNNGKDEGKKKRRRSGEDEDHFHDCLEVIKATESSSGESFKKLKVRRGEEIKITFPARNTFAESRNALDKVIIQKHAYSDRDLNQNNDAPGKYQIFPDILPDVQRRKPQEDLHGKLVQQLVATDSLEGFLKLMDRKPARKTSSKTKNKSPKLERKYTGSLWFFSKDGKKMKGVKSSPNKSPQSSNLLVTSSQPVPLSNQDRARKVRLGMTRNKLRYYDLLDDLDHNDLQPIRSEYPRRDNILVDVHDSKSYLHRMMVENDKVWKTLLQANEEKKKKETRKQQRKQSQTKVKQAKNLMEYLTAPEQKFVNHAPQTLIVMPVKVIYDNFPTKDNGDCPQASVLITDLTKEKKECPPHPSVLITDLTKEKKECPSQPSVLITDLTKEKLTKEKKEAAPPVPVEKRKEMLDQLKGLKMRNDNIQKNIQKAIDVIETKMIDLLSSPTDVGTNDAFNAMEQEITHVLKMMHDNEKKTENVEPEKDETPKPKPKPEAKKKEKLESPKREEKKVVVEVPKKKRDSSRGQSCDRFKTKKAANIEEGERLLGQVDSVIKKIDSIYNRFYDESKTKPTPKSDAKFTNIVEIFEGIKIEPPPQHPVIVNYQYRENIPEIYKQVRVFHQTSHYHPWRISLPPPVEDCSQTDIDAPTIEIKYKHAVTYDRHSDTLKVFYSLFFSSVLVALYFDYAV